MPLSVFAIIAAAGDSRRFGGRVRKPYVKLGRDPILVHSVKRLAEIASIRNMIILVNAEDEATVRRRLLPRLRRYRVAEIVVGGRTRQESVQNGLAHAPEAADLVLIHDAVRPLVRKEMIEETIRAAAKVGAAILAAPVKATLKRVGVDRLVRTTVPRDDLWAAQTPQVFRRDLIQRAYVKAKADGFWTTDDAAIVEHLGHPVAIVEGNDENIKITTREDLRMAAALLAAQRRHGSR
jgi:2-C-methyl-D-erythritol 4-phosphate cytidylyltransferase